MTSRKIIEPLLRQVFSPKRCVSAKSLSAFDDTPNNTVCVFMAGAVNVSLITVLYTVFQKKTSQHF